MWGRSLKRAAGFQLADKPPCRTIVRINESAGVLHHVEVLVGEELMHL
jgi:hypothetical protein